MSDYGIVRWRFEDPATSEVWHVPINPKEMSSPTSPRSMRYAFGSYWGVDRIRGIDKPSGVTEWSFGGVLLTKEHYDSLLEWAQKLTVVRITDHLERTFEVIITRFDPIERLPTATRAWRVDYTMTCLLLKEVTV